MESFKLNNGVDIPAIGFGPGIMWQSFSPMKVRDGIWGKLDRIYNKYVFDKQKNISYRNGIISAFRNGFRLLDYSSSYGNLWLVRDAIHSCGIPRNELFITARISNHTQRNHTVREDFLQSLKDLDLEYADLLQFHWPVPELFIDTWKEIIKLYEEGYCKSIGVANCHQHHIDKLIKETGVKPMVNQFEIHPLFTQKPLVEYCQEKGIQVEAYTPTARYDDRLIRRPLLKDIAKKHNKNITQVILRWHIQNGIIPVVRSFNGEHQKSNFEIFDFELSSDEMMAIDSLNINSRLRYDPDNCDFSIL